MARKSLGDGLEKSVDDSEYKHPHEWLVQYLIVKERPPEPVAPGQGSGIIRRAVSRASKEKADLRVFF